MDYKSKLEFLWKNIYPNSDITLLHNFLKSIEIYKNNKSVKSDKADWYKDAVIYSLYVDRFNNDFSGLEKKVGLSARFRSELLVASAYFGISYERCRI